MNTMLYIRCLVWLISLGGIPFLKGNGEKVELEKRRGGREGLGGVEGGETSVIYEKRID